MSFSKIVSIVLLALSAMMVLPARAQDIDTFVIVPEAPSGALVAGCYRADRDLFGPYRLTMCLDRRGTYTIRGGGVRCDGTLTWSASGRNIFVNIDRQSCNRGVAWEAATVECRGQSVVHGILDQIFRRNSRVIVPDLPQVNLLACTYFPSVRGERPAAFNARRQR